ncbi:hypothetical protein HOF92_02990, partial [bacterium]|nr:hypothetical protein [bacterium]
MIFRFGLALLSLTFFLTTNYFTLPITSESRIGRVLSAQGTLRIQGAKTDSGMDRTILQGSLVETSYDGSMHLHLEPGMQVKARDSTSLELRTIRELRVFQVKLLRGSAFLRVDGQGRSKAWVTEVITPFGSIEIRKGHGLVIYDSAAARLQVFCTDGSLHFLYNSLEYVLNPGESISVRDEKVASKEFIGGTQNRFLYSWYSQGQPWNPSPYFKSLKDLHKSSPPTLKNLSLNGLKSSEWESYQSFSPADLILGQIRMEGYIENFLPHQVLQVSLNGGKEFFDLAYKGGFVLKLDPEDQIYEVIFRLRDLEKFYDVVHDEIIFFFQSRGNRELVLQWTDHLISSFNSKNAVELASSLRETSTFSVSVLEDLMQEFSNRNFQKLDMILYRYRENRNFLVADFSWGSIIADSLSPEPVRRKGRFQVVFERKEGPGVYPYSMRGDLPFLHTLQKRRLDRDGPRITGPLFVSLPNKTPATIDLRVSDQLSNVSAMEYFIDRTGRDG